MSQLKEPITRDLEIYENTFGYWYYLIKEAGKIVLESDLYQTSTECAFAGVHMLDQLHDAAPLYNNDVAYGE